MKIKNLLLGLALSTGIAQADIYNIDTKGAHAFVQFKIQHLGYSWLYGRFDSFSGTFNYDEKNPSASSIEMTVDTSSVNSNHAMRDKHLRSDDFLNVDKFPQASFKSSAFSETENGNGTMLGDLTLNGVTKNIELDVQLIGAGKDPWGGYRRGYEAKGEIKLSDFKIKKSLGPKSETLFLTISVEGIKQK
ncbi:YceI family protein [Marinicella rhabdoformis]|uniref:YceI family protein n=1 Tax=Marinicella rhabdoformis TaxID=2580566 RepID=UPI0012AECFD3|nr:YceI family protein [Marinicella rhabdoformis]